MVIRDLLESCPPQLIRTLNKEEEGKEEHFNLNWMVSRDVNVFFMSPAQLCCMIQYRHCMLKAENKIIEEKMSKRIE